MGDRFQKGLSEIIDLESWREKLVEKQLKSEACTFN